MSDVIEEEDEDLATTVSSRFKTPAVSCYRAHTCVAGWNAFVHRLTFKWIT
jgi:hypothetical protein